MDHNQSRSVAFAQQDIPKIGVVDTSVIYTAYFADSRAIREAIQIQNDIEEESARVRNEITELKNQRLEAEQAQNNIEALRLSNLIAEKEQYLNDYIQIKTDRIALLTDQAALQSNLFSEIAEAIRYVAFKEGYTMILEKQNPIFLYYSVEIDITDEGEREVLGNNDLITYKPIYSQFITMNTYFDYLDVPVDNRDNYLFEVLGTPEQNINTFFNAPDNQYKTTFDLFSAESIRGRLSMA